MKRRNFFTWLVAGLSIPFLKGKEEPLKVTAKWGWGNPKPKCEIIEGDVWVYGDQTEEHYNYDPITRQWHNEVRIRYYEKAS